MLSSFFSKITVGVVLGALLLSLLPIGAQKVYALDDTGTISPTGTELTTLSGTKAGTATPTPKVEISCDKITTCLALVVYWAGPGLASGVAYIGAYFFSIVLQLSLNSTAYALDFLSTGWTLVRDFANMAFIFILVYIALVVMFQAETAGTIKTLALVVVIALLVNFSFFFTRVVIDGGNLVAVQFYNAIAKPIVASGTPGALINGNIVDLSLPIMSAVRPQVLLSNDSFQKAQKATGNSDWGALAVVSVVYISAAAMFWMLFFAFITVGIKFMLRIVGLWFVLISSPLAFVARAVPTSGVSSFFKKWLDMLVQFSFYPAIFLFIYFVLTKISAGILTTNTSGTGSIFDSVLNTASTATVATEATSVGTVVASVGIRLGLIIAVLYVGLKVSDWIVKEGSGMANLITGKVFSGAIGGAAFLGRNGIGSAGALIAKNSTLATSKNAFAQALWRGGRLASRSSFDLRGIPGVNTAAGILGGDVLRGKRLDIGKAGGEGGIYKQDKEREKKRGETQEEQGNEKRDLQNKRDRKQLAVVDAQIKQLEKKHKELTDIGEPLFPQEVDELNKLKTERKRINKGVQNYSKRELESLGAKDLEKIAHVLKESQLKTIKDSTKWTDADKEKIETKWSNESSEAPKQEIQKQVELLRKLHKDLKGLGVNLSVIAAHTDPSTNPIINGDAVTEMFKNVKERLAEENQKARDTSLTKLERVQAGQNALTLNQDVKEAITKLNDNRKKTTEGEYKVTK